ncbi:MAG: hypothetical protein ACHP84_21060, partial [Caulobacterales bacterium]
MGVTVRALLGAALLLAGAAPALAGGHGYYDSQSYHDGDSWHGDQDRAPREDAGGRDRRDQPCPCRHHRHSDEGASGHDWRGDDERRSDYLASYRPVEREDLSHEQFESAAVGYYDYDDYGDYDWGDIGPGGWAVQSGG